MTDPALSHVKIARSRLRASSVGEKPRSKNIPTKIACNPLISHDSDERIQGNPRKSNSHYRGSSPPNGDGPRKPKRARVQRSAMEALAVRRIRHGPRMLSAEILAQAARGTSLSKERTRIEGRGGASDPLVKPRGSEIRSVRGGPPNKGQMRRLARA
jgi:hypothetical protein